MLPIHSYATRGIIEAQARSALPGAPVRPVRRPRWQSG
jgi:hypothetical protein